MQNKFITLGLVLSVFAFGTEAFSQEGALGDAQKEGQKVEEISEDFSLDVSQKKMVDSPARSSLDSMEMAPLPGIYETNINGPQPMAESVSTNDMPSEQLLGRLTPEVFQEMAELERDNAYLKLQIQKEEMKNSLENLRANYRQARLDEIAKREEVVRSRIQWWQEQEKLRQEVEKERAEAEEVKNKMAEAEALKARLEAEAAAKANQEEQEALLEENLEPMIPDVILYSLVDVKGTRGNLQARIKNIATDEISVVKVGDSLKGEIVTAISSDSVVVDRKGAEYLIKFPTN